MLSAVPNLRVSEAAALLGVSDDTVRRWIDQGRLPSKQESGRMAVDGQALAAFAQELADGSVHLVVTSPPYANLKAYAPGNPSQLGDIVDYDKFLDELDKVWAECFRALVPGGRICCVVGDVNVAGERRPPLRTASGFRHSRPGTAPRLRSSAGDHLVQGREHQAGGLTIHALPGKAEPARRHRQE